MSFPRFAFLFSLLLAALLSPFSVSAAQDAQWKIYRTRDGLAGDYITAIQLAPDGSAWIGTTEGATHIEKERWTSYTRAHGLGDSWITTIALAPDERVWFGTQSGGISVFDPNTKTITTYNLDNSDIPSNFVTTLAVDSQNHVWIVTLQNGIAQFDAKKQQWLRHDFVNTQITSLLLNGNPWVTANDRIYALNGNEWRALDLPLGERVARVRLTGGRIFADTTDQTTYLREGETWQLLSPTGENLDRGKMPQDDQITVFAGRTRNGEMWIGTASGLYTLNVPSLKPIEPLPVVLIHGWTVARDDTLETSEFRFLKSYADRDGIPMFYLRGISPKNTLYQNAAVIRDEIARVKKETGAKKVNIIAFSMGGMNTRAYLETSLYASDVNRAIILGTPQAGVEVWKPILMQQILEKCDEPSAIELSPEYAQMIVNSTRAPNPNVPYDLLIGDARQQAGLEFLKDMPASDALISVHSALALDAPNVRKHDNADLHDWSPEPLPLDFTSYLYPRETWERYLRNALRNHDNAPIGSEVLSSPSTPLLNKQRLGEESNHTPVVTKKIGAGETITNTVLIDENNSARFVAYYPGGAIDFSLVTPDGKTFEPSDLPREEGSGVLSLSTDIASFSGYVVKNAQIGEWKVILTRTDGGAQAITVSAYAELDTLLRLDAYPDWGSTNTGEPHTIRALVRGKMLPPQDGLDPAQELVRDVKVNARIAQPAERFGEPFSFTELELYDDGKHNDSEVNDGLFANIYTPSRGGWHLAFVQARGENFVRENEIAFAVNPADVTLDPKTNASAQDGKITFNVGVNSVRAGNFAVSAVLRNDQTGDLLAKAFIPTKLKMGTNRIPIVFDTSRLAPAQYALAVILLDANGAAFELDRATFPAPKNLP